jgi:hypothetical protein
MVVVVAPSGFPIAMQGGPVAGRARRIGVRRLGVAAMCIVAICLAGCASETVPSLDTSLVPANAPAEGGNGPIEKTVRVADPWGKTIPNAAVLVYWLGNVSKKCDGNPCAGRLDYIALRTNQNGEAKVFLPPATRPTVVASAPRFTEEWVLGWDAKDASMKVHVYPSHASFTFNETWNTVTALQTDGSCQMYDLTLGGEVSSAAWIRHVMVANMTLTWQNGLSGVADLDLNYLPPPQPFDFFPPSCPSHGDAQPAALLPGPREAKLQLRAADLQTSFAGMEDFPSDLYYGPVARSAGVGVALPFTIHVEADLQHHFLGDKVKEYSGFSKRDVTGSPPPAPPGTAPQAGRSGASSTTATAASAGPALLVSAVSLAALVQARGRRGDARKPRRP